MSFINEFLSAFTVIIMLYCGFVFTIKTKFLPIRKFGETFKILKGDKNSKGKISSFQAFATSVAGTIGVGNIIGVAAAVTIGGAGTVFWIWLSAFLTMAIKYSEIFLAVKNKNSPVPGAFSYLRKVISKPFLNIYAFLTIAASLLMGNMVQVNAVSEYLSKSFETPPVWCGIALIFICAVPLIGFGKRVFSILGVLVPIMGAFFIIGGAALISMNAEALPDAFADIFKSAFSFSSLGGAAIFLAINKGVTIGLISNEAGLGSAAFAHYEANEDSPHKEALWGVFEVFADSIVVSSITALVLLVSNTGSVFDAFYKQFGYWGGVFTAVAVFLFGISSVFCWSFYGKTASEFFSKKMLPIYVTASIAAVFFGSVLSVETVWKFAEFFNFLMLTINLYGVYRLRNEVFDNLPCQNKARNRRYKRDAGRSLPSAVSLNNKFR
ncbi:MAG: hypothetical protein DBX47_00380 [Clostridiales bacterium]|nr:MAG: hypothetical protein DBX47_00380 [Clostridiales bacterium]